MRHSLPRLVVVCVLVLAFAVATATQPPGSGAFRILVTNDDGVLAPGLEALVTALQAVGSVTVVAPLENQSGTGHAISITDPIYATVVTLRDGTRATALAATPASCVKVALDAPLVDRLPDLVVSGVNRGYNLGMAAYVSGTVGAAREAALRGVPAIAVSLAAPADPHYDAAARVAARLAREVRVRGLDRGTFLNVNVPPGAFAQLRGVRVARQSALTGVERFEEQRTPNGRRYYWSIWQEPRRDVEGTDVWAVEHGFVAVTPLRVGEYDAPTFDRWRDLRW